MAFQRFLNYTAAQRLALADAARSVLLSGVGGAISGGVMAGAGGGINYARGNAAINSEIGNRLSSGYQGISQYGVDSANVAAYNTNTERGAINGAVDTAADSSASAGGNVGAGSNAQDSTGVLGREGTVADVVAAGGYSTGSVPSSGIVHLSPEAQQILNQRGAANVELSDSTMDPAAFSSALDSARAADIQNGWAVTPKTAEDIVNDGLRAYMSPDSAAGFAIAPDGDIEAVFANHRQGAPKKSTYSMIPAAIANGGTKLDCYGEKLAQVYSRFGFIPVARVEFNEAYANPGWDESKGTPYIYFMMHNGDSADTVVQNTGTYKTWTNEELSALPTYGRDGYDEAYAYRDSLMAEPGQGLGGGKAAAETGDTGGPEGYNRRSTELSRAIELMNSGEDISLDEVMSAPEIVRAEQENEGTPTISLPNREEIRQRAYEAAMQRGSWNGTDYTGPVRQEHRMDIVLGLPGSGKSSVYTEPLSQEYGSRVVDTDDYRADIPEYNGTNAALVHEEASLVKKRVLADALETGDNILLSIIGDDAEKLARDIQKYCDYGYSVYLHLNEVPNEVALARALGRYVSEDGTLGRYVNPRLIAAYGDKPTQTYLILTGQGGNADADIGTVAGNLRTGGQSRGGISGTAFGGIQGQTGRLAGWDWYSNDVGYGEKPRLIQSSQENTTDAAGRGITAPAGNVLPDGWANERVQQGIDEEIEYLQNKANWSGEDVDTAALIREELLNAAKEKGTDEDESSVPDYTAVDAVLEVYNDLTRRQREVIDSVIGASTLHNAAGAIQHGIGSETWFDIVNTYKDIGDEDKNASAKQTAFEHIVDTITGLTSGQRDYIKDTLTYYTVIGADASKYDALKEAGLSPDRAEYVYSLAQSAPAIYSIDGAGTSEQAVYIAQSDMTDDEKLRALSTWFSGGVDGGTYKKCTRAVEWEMGGTYTQVGSCLLPDLKLPETEQKPIGVWGQQHLRYLKEYRRTVYTSLMVSGKLSGYLADIDWQAQEMCFRLVEQPAERQGVTEALKAADPMAWVGKMNNIQAAARKVVNAELIYC